MSENLKDSNKVFEEHICEKCLTSPCCLNAGYVALTAYDVLRLSSGLGMSVEKFFKKHTVDFFKDSVYRSASRELTREKEPETGRTYITYLAKKEPYINKPSYCTFITSDNGRLRCSVYDSRPGICRNYGPQNGCITDNTYLIENCIKAKLSGTPLYENNVEHRGGLFSIYNRIIEYAYENFKEFISGKLGSPTNYDVKKYQNSITYKLKKYQDNLKKLKVSETKELTRAIVVLPQLYLPWKSMSEKQINPSKKSILELDSMKWMSNDCLYIQPVEKIEFNRNSSSYHIAILKGLNFIYSCLKFPPQFQTPKEFISFVYDLYFHFSKITLTGNRNINKYIIHIKKMANELLYNYTPIYGKDTLELPTLNHNRVSLKEILNTQMDDGSWVLPTKEKDSLLDTVRRTYIPTINNIKYIINYLNIE